MSNEYANTNQTKNSITKGGNLYIHNYTPFVITYRKHHLYQMECDFPNHINAGESYLLRVEFEAYFVIEADDRGYGTYSIDTEDGEKYIIFRYDVDTGSFNIWIDFCYSGGTLEIKEGKKRQDLGWIHNGTVEFSLFYNENTRAFSITYPDPIKLDAELYIGYYTLDIRFFEHTYAYMIEDNNHNVNFQCSGSMNGIDNIFPADYYDQNSLTKTGENSYRCNKALARILASWDPIIDWSRLNYNRGKKWQKTGSDNAGLAYAITGVCHQMCNTVLCSIYPEQPFSSPINNPPSFALSKLLYGTYGSGENRIPMIKNMIKEAYAYYENMTETNFSRLQDAFNKANEVFIIDLKKQLSGENLVQQRRFLIKEIIETDRFNALPVDSRDELIKIDLECVEKKNLLDILLIKGEISKQQYAADVNAQVDTLASVYVKLNLIKTNKIHHNLIDPEMIPDYSELRKILFK